MKIGMIVAMKSEICSAISAFGAPLAAQTVSGIDVSVYKIKDSEIYLVQSGVGEIYAAGATQMLITRYGVDAIINYGIVGGLTDEMTLCRTVVVEKVVHYDFDLSEADGCDVGRYENYPSIYLETSKKLCDAAVNVVPGLRRVICASGDKFVGSHERKKELHSLFNADICEMESAGILLTANRAGVPVLLIKSVSDSVTGGIEEAKQMTKDAAKECVKVLLKILDTNEPFI